MNHALRMLIGTGFHDRKQRRVHACIGHGGVYGDFPFVPFVVALLSLMVASNLKAQQTSSTPANARAIPAAKASSRLAADTTSFDFGRILSNADLRHIFKVKNISSSPLKIAELRSDCGVVSVESNSVEITPGASAEIVATVNSRMIRGRFDCKIFVRAEGSSDPDLVLAVGGIRTSAVQVMPQSISFEGIQGDVPEVRTARIVCSAPGSPRLKITSMPTGGGVSCELIETLPGREFLLWVNTIPPISEMTAKTMVVLDSGLADEPLIEIPITITLGSSVEISPSMISIDSKSAPNAPTPPSGNKRVVQVINRGPKPVRLLSAVCDDSTVRVSHKEIVAGRVYRIEVDIPAGFQASSGKRRITVTTDDPVTAIRYVTIEEAAAAPAERVAEKPPARRPPAMEMEGKQVPEFRLQTLVPGSEISRAEIGYWPVTVLNFVAPNCGFCKKQLPKVEQVRAKYQAQGVRFVNVSETMRQAFTAEQASKEYAAVGSNIEIAMDAGNKIGQMFSAGSYPTLVIVTADGVVQQVIVGAKPNIDVMLEERLSAIIDGKNVAPQ